MDLCAPWIYAPYGSMYPDDLAGPIVHVGRRPACLPLGQGPIPPHRRATQACCQKKGQPLDIPQLSLRSRLYPPQPAISNSR